MIEQTCPFCHEPVNPLARDTWHRVTGWERRGRNGGSDIALRERQEEFAHPWCVRLAQQGFAPTQGTLLA